MYRHLFNPVNLIRHFYTDFIKVIKSEWLLYGALFLVGDQEQQEIKKLVHMSDWKLSDGLIFQTATPDYASRFWVQASKKLPVSA